MKIIQLENCVYKICVEREEMREIIEIHYIKFSKCNRIILKYSVIN